MNPPAVLWLRARGVASAWHRPAGAWSIGKPARMLCGAEHVVDYGAQVLARAPRPTCPGCFAAVDR
jgi:hypothetical protein